MLSILIMSSLALAQEPAFYHPQQISEQSRVFASAAESSVPKFQEAETVFRAYSIGLEELEVGVLMA